ncbi:NAD(P)/FAD-dependent oxidoreductase [Nitriliruptoraceae bacterium ZYF776]|nr:NAD(P)/FAD-dependent oxidoreductase [Profundirhabdus halotolerans]
MTTATVVGSGPNGLAAAVTLAQHGVEVTVLEAADRIGGGTRSSELTLPGLVHDDCSAFHPTGVASPFLRSLGLEEHGLRWRWPEIQLAHPLDGGRAALLYRDVDRTADGLGADGPAWRRLFGPLARRFDVLAEEVFQPVLHVPRHPLTFARFGVAALLPATLLARAWRDDPARALFGGVAAHLVGSLSAPLSSSVGVMLTAAAHAHGWPVAEGGSQAIADALASKLRALGGRIETGIEVTDLDDCRGADLTVLSLSPLAVAGVLGDRLPPRTRRAYRRYRYGPGAFKLDLAVEGGVPWAVPEVARAGTVHLAGSFEELVHAERTTVRGRLAGRPYVLLGQQAAADPSRAVGDLQPVWAYAHVPNGFDGDATEAILGQVERFAPGFRARIRACHVRSTTQMATHNANYVGGDINVGRNTPLQLVARPRWTLRPYRAGVEDVFLCGSATPPGAGVHGMSGHNAALDALGRSTVLGRGWSRRGGHDEP